MQEKLYSFTDVKQSEEMDTGGPESERVKCFKLATDMFKHICQMCHVGINCIPSD